MNDETIRHLQENIERCHRLARATIDLGVIKALLEIAAEKEADLARIWLSLLLKFLLFGRPSQLEGLPPFRCRNSACARRPSYYRPG